MTSALRMLVILWASLPCALLAQGSLVLSFTNTVLQESAGTLAHWGRIEATPCPTQTVEVILSVSDTSELIITNSLMLTSNTCIGYFDLTPVWDEIVDGRQTVTLFASAQNYGATSATVDVHHTGGPTRQLQFETDAYLNTFSRVQSNFLSGPVQVDFSGCLELPLQNEVYILLNRIPSKRRDPKLASIQIYQSDGTYQRSITLEDFDDAEGFCQISVSNTLFAIVEEGNTDRLTLINIATNDTLVNRSSGTSYAIDLPAGKVVNKGLEGVVYDELNDCFYVVQEQPPMGVYRIVLDGSNATLDVLFNAEVVFSGLATDLSDIGFDPVTGNLLILSDEAKMLTK